MSRLKMVFVCLLVVTMSLGSVGVLQAADPTPTPAGPAASATPDGGSSGKLQIVVVMDVSASMNTHVFGSQLPEELATLQAQIEAVEKSDAFAKLSEKQGQAQASTEIQQVTQAMSDANAAVEKWLSDHGYGRTTGVVGRKLADLAISFGCDSLSGPYQDAATATNTANALAQVKAACSKKGVTPTKDQQEQLKAVIAYLDDQEYHDLVAKADKAHSDYLTALTTGPMMKAIQEVMNDPEFKQYFSLIRQREALAAKYKVPTRLDLAKQAVHTLLDLSHLDSLSGHGDSSVGLVTFSNTAFLIQSLTGDYDVLQAQVDDIKLQRETNVGEGILAALDELKAHGDPAQPSLIILLSDGQTNIGLTSEQIGQQVPEEAGPMNTKICSVGFGNKEAEVDAKLLQGLAETSGGQYLFAKSGEELIGFFMACRQGLLAQGLKQFAGIITGSEPVEAGQFSVADGATELQVSLSYQAGTASAQLLDPAGQTVDASYSGAHIEQADKVQLIVIKNPKPGDWTVMVSGVDLPENGTTYNVVITGQQAPAPPTSPPAATGVPGAASASAAPSQLLLIGAIACGGILVLVVGVAAVVVVAIARRRKAPPTIE